MKSYLLSILQTIINGYVDLDPYAATLRQPLLNKTIAIDAREIPFTLFFHFTPDKILLLPHSDQPNATIQGSLFSMALLTRKKNPATAMKELAITLTGNTDSAHQFQRFWDSIHIDWEEVISSVIGDPLAVLLGRGASVINRALQHARKTVVQNTGEYLQEELRLLPPREEIADFMHDVDKLRSDTDRLIARLHRLDIPHE